MKIVDEGKQHARKAVWSQATSWKLALHMSQADLAPIVDGSFVLGKVHEVDAASLVAGRGGEVIGALL